MADERKPVSTRTRFEIFKRDQFTCQYCGRRPPVVVLQVDHIDPVAAGGTNDTANLVTACEECNLGKSDRPLDEAPAARADEIRRRQERAEQTAQLNAWLKEQREETDNIISDLGAYWFNKSASANDIDRFTFNEHCASSIRRFLEQLTEAEILDCIDIAYARKPWGSGGRLYVPSWRYFCGVCWKKIKER